MSSWTVCIPEFLESWVIILTPAILLYLQDIVLWYTNHSVPWLFNYRLSKSSWPILHSVLLYELGQVFLDEQLDWTGFLRLKDLKLTWSIDHFKGFVYIGLLKGFYNVILYAQNLSVVRLCTKIVMFFQQNSFKTGSYPLILISGITHFNLHI